MKLQFESTDIFTDIDPGLQRILERKSLGITTPATASTEEGEIAVIAKVNNLEEWLAMNEVYPGADMGSTPTGERIVTARVPVARLEQIKQSPWVVSLKSAQPLQPTLSHTLEEMSVTKHLLPENIPGSQGDDVVIGIIDGGCDFAHKNFRYPDGSTRLLAFWNQDGSPSHHSPYDYGKEYKQDEINQALQASDPYAALGYKPVHKAHGTHVMDIAAGNGQGSGVPGVAPAADIVFVHLSETEIVSSLEDGERAVQESFGDTVALLEAMAYIFDIAGDRPCVVNISLGLYGGPHDGTTLIEQSIDALVTAKPNRAIVIAAGNEYDSGIHASGTVPQDGYFDLKWKIPHKHPRQTEIEIWYSKDDQFQLEILSPDGSSLGVINLGSNGKVVDSENESLMFFAHRQGDPNNGDNVICIFMEPDLPEGGGVWKLRLHGVKVTDGKFHAWIERDTIQTTFVPPHHRSHTLNTIACGYKSIVVGSYDAKKRNKPLSYFTSAGPTRDGRQKPDFIAPGHHVRAANSLTGTGIIRKSGTSMAAPAVTGVIALMLAEARARNLQLTIDQIRHILAASTKENFPQPREQERYGYGAIDAFAAISRIRQS
ncbi:MAG: S8 family peptidase [Calothrix sp. MO_167.B12]|nr:S8 family peptidase [Calothrix sp. MO_167.B12]